MSEWYLLLGVDGAEEHFLYVAHHGHFVRVLERVLDVLLRLCRLRDEKKKISRLPTWQCRLHKGTGSQSVVVCEAKYPGGKS